MGVRPPLLNGVELVDLYERLYLRMILIGKDHRMMGIPVKFSFRFWRLRMGNLSWIPQVFFHF